MSKANHHLQREVVNRARQRLEVLTEGAQAFANIRLSRKEIQMILGSGVEGGSVGVKLHKALKEIAKYEAVGARNAQDMDDWNDYMGGGNAFPPKRMAAMYDKQVAAAEAEKMKNPKYRAAQERGEAWRKSLR